MEDRGEDREGASLSTTNSLVALGSCVLPRLILEITTFEFVTNIVDCPLKKQIGWKYK